ncbi:MAG: hypothetical protein IKP20_07865, partial [Candidatus Methanomethylophilaceae archaeon]|nr:hypothetical protein [Candidatus Methanomethylophilaceae archaeon]
MGTYLPNSLVCTKSTLKHTKTPLMMDENHRNYENKKLRMSATYETRLTARPHPSGAWDVSEPGLNISADLDAYIRLLSDPSS